jgi:type II secretory pathway pseudopilin PulG
VGIEFRFQGYDGGGFLNIRNYSTGGAGTVVIRKLASQTSDLLKVLDDSGNNLFSLQHTGDFALGLNSTTNPDIYSYGSFTDNSNYERLKIEAGTAYNIRVQAAGTGTGRDLNIHSGASAALRLGVDGTNYIIMTSSGVKPAQDLFPNANNSYKNGTTSNRWSETNTVDLNSTGDINFSGLPTSSSGLSTGDLYLQSSGNPAGDYQIMVKA